MDNNNTYNQPQMGQGMPRQTQHPRMPIRQRMANGARRIQNVFPKWLSTYPIVVYILALLVVSFMYSDYSLPWYYMLSGIVAVLVFFLLGSTFATRTSIDKIHNEKRFEKKIFLIAFIPRVLFMLLLYEIFQANYGNAFGFENADAKYYDDLGKFVAGLIEKGNFSFYDEISRWSGNDDISDMGYGVYVGIIYWLMGVKNLTATHMLADGSTTSAMIILTVRFIKCIISSITVLLIYRLAKRNFGEQTARVSAIFVALWPNFWYYCAVHLKETEMVFLCVLFIEQADLMLRSRQFTAWKIIPILLIAASIFTFRTPLGIVALLALVFSVVMSSTKVVSWGKRIIIGVLAIVLILSVAGNVIEEKAQKLVETAQSGRQQNNMEWRGERENGNTLAKYAGASVFAPMIFTLPFPSMVRPFDGQNEQQIANGGNFVKNIMSCFTIFAVIMLLMSGKWREHLLPLSFMLGYVFVLVMSEFAHSERFHQPVVAFEFMFAAYGLSIAVTKPKYKRWFTYWCVLMFIACIAWNWFKMAGRGLA